MCPLDKVDVLGTVLETAELARGITQGWGLKHSTTMTGGGSVEGQASGLPVSLREDNKLKLESLGPIKSN